MFGETLIAPALISRICAMMLFPYPGLSRTRCSISNGKTSRVLTSLKNKSFGVALCDDRRAGSAKPSTPTFSTKPVNIDNFTLNKFCAKVRAPLELGFGEAPHKEERQ